MSDNFQLSKNTINHLFRSLQNQYPNVEKAEIQKIGEALIQNLSTKMDEGYHAAVARPNFDGSMDLIVLTVEKLTKSRGK